MMRKVSAMHVGALHSGEDPRFMMLACDFGTSLLCTQKKDCSQLINGVGKSPLTHSMQPFRLSTGTKSAP